VKKSKRFLRRLFQAAVEIFKRKAPKASFLDFHGCGSFHRPLLSFFLVLFLSLRLPVEMWEIPKAVTAGPSYEYIPQPFDG